MRCFRVYCACCLEELSYSDNNMWVHSLTYTKRCRLNRVGANVLYGEANPFLNTSQLFRLKYCMWGNDHSVAHCKECNGFDRNLNTLTSEMNWKLSNHRPDYNLEWISEKR